jgi:divalent metal cation (Fe/Co/Zn/Cd) transporter
MTVSTYLVGVLNLFFGACLFFAVHQISKYVDKLGSGINKKALVLHAVSFGLYMLSVIVVDGFYANYQFKEGQQHQNDIYHAQNMFLFSTIFMSVASLFSQLILIAIFWELGTKKAKA